MSGTLTITSPAVDNEAGHDSSFLPIVWSFVGDATASQVQRRVTVQRAGSNELIADTDMQATTSTTYVVTNMSSGIYYLVTVYVRDSNGGVTSATRTIIARYVRSLPPVLTLTPVPNGIEVTVLNPGAGDRPPITSTAVYRRAAGSNADWTLVTTVYPNGTFIDREVRSSRAYEYFGRGVSSPGAASVSGLVSGVGTLSAQLGTPGGNATVDNAVVDLSMVGA